MSYCKSYSTCLPHASDSLSGCANTFQNHHRALKPRVFSLHQYWNAENLVMHQCWLCSQILLRQKATAQAACTLVQLMTAIVYAKLDQRAGREHHLLDPTARYLFRLRPSQWCTCVSWSHSGVCPDTADCFDCALERVLHAACLFVGVFA